MSVMYILYNPIASAGGCENEARALMADYADSKLLDVTKIEDFSAFVGQLEAEDEIILCGGDGTLNHLANAVREISLKNKIYYYPCGSGNDFGRDIGIQKEGKTPVCINQYLKDLPTVTVNGEERVFINGVGYGIDGYCCEEGDRLREVADKAVDYTAIAIKGLLFYYKPTNATITVDGNKYTYKKVWLAPTMFGRYYGGGMIPTPGQTRLNEEKTLSVLSFHGSGKLKSLIMFPSIFKGEHVKYKKHIQVLSGKEITVEFDRPTPLQIDGETVPNVTKYTARIK